MTVGEGGGATSQDFDLNLAPIIDCFVVLITYLLVSASFLSLTVLDVGVAANGESTSVPTESPVNLELTITTTKTVAVKISGGSQNLDITIPVNAAMGDSWDLVSLNSEISRTIAKYPAIQDVSVTAESGVKYKDIVKIVESIKKVIPKVFIAG